MALDAYHIDYVNTCYNYTAVKCFLVVKKEKNTAEILKTHTRFRHFDFQQLAQVLATLGPGNDHVTAARRASLIDILCPCENGESQQVTYPDGKLI